MTDKDLQEIKGTLREISALLRELRDLLCLLKTEKTLREHEPFNPPITHPPWVYEAHGWVPVDEAEVPLPEGKSEVKGNTGG